MALDLADRLLTIAVTATLTTAAWIVVGSELVRVEQGEAVSRTAARTTPEPAAPQATGPLLVPVAGITVAQLGDTFDDLRGQRRHEALDIAAPAGSRVVAAAAGRIEKLFVSEDGGNTVYVRSADRRRVYYYAHLADYAPGLREGMQVERGQPLGTVGSTGNADPASPHLHFAIKRVTDDAQWWQPGVAVNPYPLLLAFY